MDFNYPPRRPPEDPDELDACLVELITRAWGTGWMPADLLAAVDHECDRRTVPLTAALIQREHTERDYGGRLSARWQSQLASVREVTADPTGTINARKRGWRSDRLELWSLLGCLPNLSQLGPLPGEADPETSRSDGKENSGTGEPIDHNVLRRVRALLAKAESSDFDAEADAFTAKAQAMISEHSLAAALRSGVGADTTDGPDSIRLAVERPYDREKFHLLAVVGRANRCQAILHDRLGFATIIGYPIDLDATELLFTSLLVQATRAMHRHGSTTDAYGNSTTKAFRRSFLVGFAGRIGERLTAETERATTEAAAASPDTPLLPVLAGRADRVESAVGDAFPRLTSMRQSRAAFDGSGYTAGVSAADRADLAARRPLAS
jgi:hypothetical protein